MRFGHKKAISIEISTTVKNAALSLVIGLATFPTLIIPPLIANLIAQNLFLIPAKAITEKIAAHQTLVQNQCQRLKGDGDVAADS
jgi:predicted Na+-dependent transporter